MRGRPLTADDDPIFADYSQMFKFRNMLSTNLQIHLTPPTHWLQQPDSAQLGRGNYAADCENLTTYWKSNSVSINQI